MYCYDVVVQVKSWHDSININIYNFDGSTIYYLLIPGRLAKRVSTQNKRYTTGEYNMLHAAPFLPLAMNGELRRREVAHACGGR